MKGILPTFETVFTESYWNEVEELPAKYYDGGFIPAKTEKQMDILTGQAAEAIFRGDSRQQVPVGTNLGKPGESYYTLPGNVLLVDIEALVPDKIWPSAKQVRNDENSPFYSQIFIHNEGDLMALPTSLFMRNSARTQDEQVVVVYPYAKSIPYSVNGSRYARSVRLFVYGYDRKNNPAVRAESWWDRLPEGSIQGRSSALDALGRIPALAVGDSYHVRKSIVRVKSAELCVSGLLEPVKNKQKKRKVIFAGRLATSQAIA